MTELPDQGGGRLAILTVHPSVVFKLGEDLITDDVQALTELIKNAYDADSPSAAVTIDTQAWTLAHSGEKVSAERVRELDRERLRLERAIEALAQKRPASDDQLIQLQQELADLPVPLRGIIEVVDSGTGMTFEDIERGWLTVSASRKRRMKELGLQTKGGRVPLGDKGLGRLGAQRLGKVLELTTRAKGQDTTLHAQIVWSDFDDVDSLQDVPIRIARVTTAAKAGSQIRIRGLTSPDQWGSGSTRQLESDLANMLSPYSDVGFRVRLTIDGVRVDLRERSAALLRSSALTYRFRFDGASLHISGGASARYLRPDRGQDAIRDWDRYVGHDNGFGFLTWLLETKGPSDYNLEHGDDRYFCHFSSHVDLADTQEVEFEASTDELSRNPVNPGAFDGQVDVLQLRSLQEDSRQLLDSLAGVRVYRDGFGIKVSEDWLNFASQWSTGKSWYTIRPQNVVGYVNLSAGSNAVLVETSDREDFQDTPAYRNFQRLLGQWVRFTADVQTYLRRNYNAFVKERREAESGIDANTSAQEIADQLTSQLNAGKAAADLSKDVGRQIRRANAALDRAEGAPSGRGVTPAAASSTSASHRAYEEARATLRSLEVTAAAAEAALESARDRSEGLKVLVERLEDAQRQVEDMWELISLGLTAESVSHEVKNVTDQLVGRSAQIARYNDSSLQDSRVAAFVEHVRTAARSLAKQVSHLDASLRFTREERGELSLAAVAAEFADYYSERGPNLGIDYQVVVEKDITVRISRGKLSQVLDNLLLNSAYWLEQEPATDAKSVLLTVDSPYLTVEDSGRGIDPTVEQSLFDPFVTRKPNRRGRGLGLFVCRQLLDSEGAVISLDPARNRHGRLYRFRIDFSSLI